MSTDPTERRSEIVTIDGTRYRIREPAPTTCYTVIGWCGRMLGPVFAQVLGGSLIDKEPALCPTCGTKDDAVPLKGEWLCNVKLSAAEGVTRVCGTRWAQRPMVDAAGKPQRVTLEYALSSQRWREVLGAEIRKALKLLDPDDNTAFMHEVLVGNLDFEAAQDWVPIKSIADLDNFVHNGSALVQIMKVAMSCWILPSFADGLSTPPVSSAESTPGVLGPATSPSSHRIPGPPLTQAST